MTVDFNNPAEIRDAAEAIAAEFPERIDEADDLMDLADRVEEVQRIAAVAELDPDEGGTDSDEDWEDAGFTIWDEFDV